MLRFTFFISLVSFYYSVAAQNLVPNPSFEDTLQCPITSGCLELCCEMWSTWRGNPSLFHECSSVVNVPDNNLNFQATVSGQAYTGITCYTSWEPDWRHIMGVELLDTLEIGETYYVSFYLNKATFFDYPGRACNKQGVRFFTSNFSEQDWIPLDNWAHVVNDLVLTDTLLWYFVKGSIIADSSYRYLAIGNFFSDSNTTFTDSPEFSDHRAFYLVDEVRVSTDSAYAFEELVPTHIAAYSENLRNLVYPNPTRETFQIKTRWDKLYILDLFGRQVFQSSFYKEQINVSHLPKGVYIVWVDNQSVKLIKE